MKIRWKHNSLRLRITPSELSALMHGSTVREELRLPFDTNPVWSVDIISGATESSITAQGNTVCFLLSQPDLAAFSAPEEEGLYLHTDGPEGRFSYYIEKDFPCIHPRPAEAAEAATETFAPPFDFALRK